jgi:hypothetical protein
MGFLSATQEGQKEPRIKQWMLGFPEIGPLAYIWDWICEIGLGTSITWAEIKAWSDITGIEPTKNEAFALVQLSNAWLNERNRGQGKHETPDWAGE